MIEGLHEVILYVDDMADQVAFYRDTLGLELSFPEQIDETGDLDWVTFETGACTLALHSGGTDGGVEGSPEIVFEVGNIEAAVAELSERGVEFGEIREPGPGVRVASARDPEGNPFSIESVSRD